MCRGDIEVSDYIDTRELAEEILAFCTKYELFSNWENMKIEKIAEQLKECWYVEQLIHNIIVASRFRKNINYWKIRQLILALEKLRLKLHYEKWIL